MLSTRLFKLLLLVVAIVAVAHASWLDSGRSHENALARRQNSGDEDPSSDAPSSTGGQSADPTDGGDGDEPTPTEDGDDGDEDPSSTDGGSAPDPTTAPEDNTTEAPEQTTTDPPSTTSSSSTSSSTSSSVQEEEESSSDEPSQTTTSEEAESTSAEEKEDQTTQSRYTSTKVQVVTKTNEDGSKETATSTSVTTGTAEAGLNADDSDDDGGMSDSTRNTIIGVVVGVGGAIVLGAIALVAWRIWGRRKRAEENDALMDYDHGRPLGNSGVEKTTEPPSTAGGSTAPSRSPFQQTLESYHSPGQVNASSNF